MKHELEKELLDAGINAKVTLGEIRIVVRGLLNSHYEFPRPYDLNLSESLAYAYDSPTLMEVDYALTPKSQEKFDEWKISQNDINALSVEENVSAAIRKITLKNTLQKMYEEEYIILTVAGTPNYPVYLLGKDDEVYKFYEMEERCGSLYDHGFRKESGLDGREKTKKYKLRLEGIVNRCSKTCFVSVVKAEKMPDGKFIIPISTDNKDNQVFIALDPKNLSLKNHTEIQQLPMVWL